MTDFIHAFNNMCKDQMTDVITIPPIYYTDESYEIAMTAINEEGSGVLVVDCCVSSTVDLFQLFLKNLYKSVYVLELNGTKISVLIDETIFNIDEESIRSTVMSDDEESIRSTVMSDDEECSVIVCQSTCKCINCLTEKMESDETKCVDDCNCINCHSKKHVSCLPV
jgi:hypothetical protein